MKKWIYLITLLVSLVTLSACTNAIEITISFDSNGGSSIQPITTDGVSSVTTPIDPVKEGYTFEGWFTNSEPTSLFDFTMMPAQNITIYAKWKIITYTITYDLNEGMNHLNNPTSFNVESSINLFEPFRIGHTFTGWYLDSDFSGNVISNIAVGTTGNINLYAKWMINSYTITFNSNGGTYITAITQDYASEVSEPEEPIRENYTFEGWFRNSALTNAYTFTTMPAQNISLYAKWTITTYTITYELNNGTNHTNNPTSFNVDSSFDLLEPTKTGHTFDGWYLDSDFSGNVNSNIVVGTIGNLKLYAKWTINSYTISYTIYDVDYDPLKNIVLNLGESITQVSLYNHSSALTSSGRLFTWGYNPHAQLGDGTTTQRNTPNEITARFNLNEGERIIQVSLGGYGNHSSALTSSGRLFTWGENNYGQLGDGTTTQRNTPNEITARFNLNEGEKIIQVSLGGYHSSALTSSGRLFTWGYNLYGQLGNVFSLDRKDRTTPTDITARFNLSSGETIIQVSLGDYHSSALTSNGRVFTWGWNYYGQTGSRERNSPGDNSRYTPVEITARFNLNEGERIIQVSLGFRHSSALTSSGRLFTWGHNDRGQLGDGTTTERYTPVEITAHFNLNEGERIIQVSLGYRHSSALTSTGRLFTWGANYIYQLGTGTNVYNITTPTEITARFNLSLGETITQVSLGADHSSALTSTGRLFTWGSNSSGELGDGTTTKRITPTQMNFNIATGESIDYVFNETLSENIPVREGHTFSGWFTDSTLTKPYTFLTMPAQNITLYGKWNKV
jgi:uncharacterized repeat protein (TIGR02543 family)